MTNYGLFRHMNLQLSHLSDEEIDELLTNNSDEIDAERIKAEAWDRLLDVLKQSRQTPVIYIMKTIYNDVKNGR